MLQGLNRKKSSQTPHISEPPPATFPEWATLSVHCHSSISFSFLHPAPWLPFIEHLPWVHRVLHAFSAVYLVIFPPFIMRPPAIQNKNNNKKKQQKTTPPIAVVQHQRGLFLLPTTLPGQLSFTHSFAPWPCPWCCLTPSRTPGSSASNGWLGKSE